MQLRYQFDAGSGVCLWAADAAARERYDYAVALAALPLSPRLRAIGERLIADYDGSIDGSNPAGPSPWTAQQRDDFDRRAQHYLQALRSALAPAITVVCDGIG